MFIPPKVQLINHSFHTKSSSSKKKRQDKLPTLYMIHRITTIYIHILELSPDRRQVSVITSILKFLPEIFNNPKNSDVMTMGPGSHRVLCTNIAKKNDIIA